MMWLPIIVECPPVSVNHLNGNVALSTFNTAVGTIVKFVCPRSGDVLVGSSFLQCMKTGNWNGTVPRCVSGSDLTTGNTLTTETANLTSSTELYATASPAENEVETVVVLLWTIGGLLLVTLVVLMACIVRSHHKGRRDRANMVRTNGGRNQRHGGGVNPSFTSYDEIWTWIPVVTDSQANCPSQINPSARVNSSTVINSANNQERQLLSTLRLPSYNEAVRNEVNTSSGAVNARHDNAHTEQPTTSQVSNNRRNNEQCNRNRISAQINNQSASLQTQTPIIENHYETIPADIRPLPTVYSAANNVTHISVTTSSGAAVSASGAPALVHQRPSHSNARALPSVSVQSPRPETGRLHNSAMGDNATSNARVLDSGNVQNGSDNRRRNDVSNQDATVPMGQDENYSSELRSCSYSIYPQYDTSQGGTQVEFRHSEGSSFHYYGLDHSRRVRSDIPPFPTRQLAQPAQGSQSRLASHVITSRDRRLPASILASEYF